MAKVTVDGIEIEVPNNYSVLQAAEAAGREIPRFCYHERLSVAGNCRMCLVEIEKMPKPVASCGQPVGEGMVIYTDNEKIRAARRNVMEFLLINHPLDCPICDQGGECDLQDEAVGYGRARSRYEENKRAVTDKYLGPLVKTVMTRCIHCTRCVRFLAEVAGVPELGGTARGESMEITNYVERALSSELSGNIVDICPVGALTSKPYAFVARTWELNKTDSIDVLDAVGTNIRVDTKGGTVLRILPRRHDGVNEDWLADKGRHAPVDGIKYRRLDRPWLRENGTLREARWDEAFDAIAARMRAVAGARIGAIAGDLCDVESMFALKRLMAGLGSGNLDCRQDGAALDASRRDYYLFNTTIVGIDEIDALLVIGADIRREAPVLNARIRRRWADLPSFQVGLIGAEVDLTYPTTWIGEGPAALACLLDGSHDFAKILAGAKNPAVIIGQSALTRADGAAVLAACWQLAVQFNMIRSDWHGFNVLHRAAARVGGLDIGFVPQAGGLDAGAMLAGGVDVLWLLAADEIDATAVPGSCFVVYQGHHGDAGAARADVILPGASYLEKSGLYVNTEGRVQAASQACFPPGDAREDWTILRAFSEHVGHRLGFDALAGLRAQLAAEYPIFGDIGDCRRLASLDVTGPAGDPAGMGADAFARPMPVYYQTDPISRASPTMARCVAEIAAPMQAAAE
ncbi:MAG TPA: NADH-quinone oxidoreductase subunit NuoG [Acidiphilium sp.]|nr:MAG: NADH-quinone oxidoreductase subunit G [Acidiphilium sp. 37-60-79]OZB38906.1 MAG: NADH-quinone oxidoreductase subunit G [Acidiphilium sp. 34-60-192]HQT88609.1 NADH-quinone oxidoreductase subunit NuoG [Acidiphilium sp.]